MLMFRRSSLVFQSCVRFHLLLNHSEHSSNQIISLTRFIGNSGCLISGCCFSRQSDEEILLPKSSHEVSDKQTVNSSQLSSAIVQHLRNFFRMKRRISHDEISSQHVIVTSDELVETFRKKQKTEDDNRNDSVKEVHSVVAPTNENLDLRNDDALRSEKAVERPKKQRPNYFVAIRISDAQIVKTLNELQQHILDKDARLRKSVIELTTLHITLMVMYIGDPETHARALKTLQNIHEEHDDDLSRNPLKLEFKGLSHFQNRVLYAKLSANESYRRLCSLVESVKKHYSSAFIFSTDAKTDFTPHLTVVKIRDAWKKKEFPKKINPTLYKDFNDNFFGTQEVQSIQLLRMTGPKDEDGYYTGNEIYFSAFEPKVRRDYLNKMLETEEKKKNVKYIINALMKEKFK